MQDPIIISGEFKDPFPADVNPVDDDGNINWFDAMRADPGVVKCPGCKTFYWRLADKMKCSKCETIFDQRGIKQTP